jgi:hypothetical protein
VLRHRCVVRQDPMMPSILAVNLLSARVWCSRSDPRIAFRAAYVLQHMILHHIHAQPLAQYQALVHDDDWHALVVAIEAFPRSPIRMVRGRGCYDTLAAKSTTMACHRAAKMRGVFSLSPKTGARRIA